MSHFGIAIKAIKNINSKRTAIILLVAVALLSLNFSTQAQASSELLKGMRLISLKNSKDACAVLEKLYHSKTTKNSERFIAARLLSVQSNKDLKMAKRHVYAENALKLGGEGWADQSTKDGLMRTLGDGYFDEMILDKAAKWYSELTKSPDQEQVDYGHYKLGWVELNDKRPVNAYKIFRDRLVGEHKAGPDFKSLLVRDMARAWAESAGTAAPVSELTSDSSYEQKTVVEGIINGLRRLKEDSEIASLRTALLQSALATDVISALISQGTGRADADCAIIDWVEGRDDLAKLSREPLLERLNACVRVIEHDHKTENWKDITRAQRLATLYRSLELNGANRWVKALLLKRIGDRAGAMNEYAKLLGEQDAFPEEGAAAISNASGQFISLINTATAEEAEGLVEPLTKALAASINTGHLGTIEANPRYAVFQAAINQSAFLAGALNAISKDGPTFSNSLIPALVIEKLPNDELEQKSSMALATFAPSAIFAKRPDRDVWIRLLQSRVNYMLKNGLEEHVQPLLITKAPLVLTSDDEETTKTKLRLWSLWVSKVDPKKLDHAGLTAAHTVIMTMLSRADQNKESAFALALKYDMLSDIWEAADTIGLPKFFNSKNMAAFKTPFYTQSVKAYFDGTLTPQVLSQTAEGQALAKTCALVGATSMVVHQTMAELTASSVRIMPDLKIAKDLYAKGTKLNSAKLRMNGRLPKEIEFRINTIKKHIDRIQAQSWSHESIAGLTRRVVAATCDGFIDDLNTLQNPSDLDQESIENWNNQLAGLVSMVQELRATLIAPTVRARTMQGGL